MKRKLHISSDLFEPNFPPEIILEIIYGISHEYPWQSINFIRNELKNVCCTWAELIDYNIEYIYKNLGMEKIHYLALTNQADELMRLNMKDNIPLRIPDLRGWSPACYAVANGSYNVARRLKIAYALDTDIISCEKLLKLIPIREKECIKLKKLLKDNTDEFTMNDIKNKIGDLKTAIRLKSMNEIEKILLWGIDYEEHFFGRSFFSCHSEFYHMGLLEDSPINELIYYAYKNWLAYSFWYDISCHIDDNMMPKYLACSIISSNFCNEKKYTILHILSSYENTLPIIKHILGKKNININVRAIDSLTPLDIAILFDCTEIITYLKSKGAK